MNKAKGGSRIAYATGIDHFRMGKLNFDIDEAFLLKTYGLSTLAPTYAFSAILPLAITERWDTGNGKILTMSWTSRLKGLY